MNNTVTTHVRSIFFVLVLLVLYSFTLNSAYSQQYVCLPNCDVTDGKMFAFSGVGLATTNEDVLELRVTSPASSANFEIGIFDGDENNTWDVIIGLPAFLDIEVFLDPNGDGSGNVSIARFSSDGSFGDNMGNPMPDNDWFQAILPNDPGALNADGDKYIYKLTITNLNNATSSANTFKVRSDGQLFAVAGQPFSYLILLTTLEAFEIVFPDLDFFDPACTDATAFLPFQYCDPADPNCCLHNTTYDGSWDFNILVPAGVETLEIWDGDLDFGSASFDQNGICNFADGVDLDSDDPNTPDNIIPPWAVGTSVNFESSSSPTNPSDDAGCSRIISRPPSVFYSVIGPNGETYTNNNPSGNQEWELFNITTNPPDPMLYDVSVPSIPRGVWRVEVTGNDFTNLNAFVLPFDLCAVDEQGNPVGCDEEEFVLNPIFPALDDNINFISAENATPNGNVAFVWGKKRGEFTLGGRICNGAIFGIQNPRLLAIERANDFGVATHIFYIPFFNDFEFAIQLHALDIISCDISNQIEQVIRKDDEGAGS